MADEIEVPAVGRVPKKWAYAGGALVLGIAGYAWWQYSRNRAAAAAEDPLAIEPEQPDTGGAYTNPRPVNSTVDGTGGAIATNSQWSDKVTEKLGQLGYDSAFLSAAIGAYLSRQQLTADQGDLIRTAWAYVGKPPEGPETFTLKGSSTGDTNPPPSGGGDGQLAAPTGLRQGDPSQWQNAARLDWNAVPGAVGYVLTEVTGQAGGWESPLEVGPVNATMKYGLVHGGSYHVQIQAKGANGQLSPASPTIVVHTHN